MAPYKCIQYSLCKRLHFAWAAMGGRVEAVERVAVQGAVTVGHTPAALK